MITSIIPPGIKAAVVMVTVLTGSHHPSTVTVHSGDTLSSIAAHRYGSEQAWPAIWWDNRRRVPNPNVIRAGEHLSMPASGKVPAWLARAAEQALPAAAVTAARITTRAPGRGQPARDIHTSPAPAGSYQACVIARESGGNAQVMNSSGHYGLYQFSASTWQAYGGSAAEFGHASAAEQTRIFNNAMAAGGQSNWSPYDGC